MRLALDVYIDRPSWLHRWHPKLKFIGLLVLIFAFASVHYLWLLLPMVAVTIALYLCSRLPLSLWLTRWRYPGFFLLGIIALLPFLSGRTVIWQWGWLSIYQEGCEAVLLIAVRFSCIWTIALLLLATTPFLAILAALRSLGVSPILTDMTLLTYRYLHDIGETLTTMQIAMQLRGGDRWQQHWFQPDWRKLPQFAMLLGTLLIRSYEQSERVYQAMRLRGYSLQSSSSGRSTQIGWKSTIGLMISLLVATGFVLADMLQVGSLVQ